MNRQIVLFRPGARNSADGSNYPPSPVITTWGAIRALSGQELDRAQQIAQEIGHLISIPYQTGVTLDLLPRFENRSFLIKYIGEDEELHIFLDLYCAEVGQNAGSQL